MKTKLFLLFLIAFAIGCKSERKTDENSNSEFKNEVVEQSITQFIALQGRMDNIPVSFALFVIKNKVYGFYLYSKVGEPINLNGYIDDQKQIFLDEYERTSKKSKIELKFDETLGKYIGKWYNSKKSLLLNLSTVATKDNSVEFETNIGKLSATYFYGDTTIKNIDCHIYKVVLNYKWKKAQDVNYDFSSQIIAPDFSQNVNLEKALNQMSKPYENIASNAYWIENSMFSEWADLLKESKNEEEVFGYNYSLETSSNFVDLFEDIYVFEKSHSDYMGGAHGMYGIDYSYADAKTGKLLYDYDIIDTNKKAEISDLITQKVQNDENLNAKVYTSDDIPCSSYIKLTKDSLSFLYQPYEIASFADGVVEIPFSYKEIKPYLKQSFLKRIGL